MWSYLFTNPLLFFSYLFALFIALTIHEFAHAWMADRLGDPTARLQGRLSLNPFVHIDNLGLMMLLFFGFGWGKAVPFDPFNLKNPHKDAALISLAGPMSNLLLALTLSLILKLFNYFQLNLLIIIGQYLFIPLIVFNVFLGVFNLLPINPLDGFKIVAGILPKNKLDEWLSLEKYGIIFLLLIIFPINGQSMIDLFIRPLTSFILSLLLNKGMLI
jgi:Zn-dependent protease